MCFSTACLFVWVVHSVSGLNWKETPPWFLARILRQPAIFLIFLTATVNQTTRRPKAPALSLQLDSAQTTHTVTWHAVDTRGIAIMRLFHHLFHPPPGDLHAPLDPRGSIITKASADRLSLILSATPLFKRDLSPETSLHTSWASVRFSIQGFATSFHVPSSSLTVHILPGHDGEEEQMLSNVNDHKLPHVEPIIVCRSTFSPKTSHGAHTTVENYT